jgi:hypothetical protein
MCLRRSSDYSGAKICASFIKMAPIIRLKKVFFFSLSSSLWVISKTLCLGIFELEMDLWVFVCVRSTKHFVFVFLEFLKCSVAV